MKYEVFENIDVIVYFHKVSANIIRFKRGETIYKVSRTVNKWKLKEGGSKVTHFIVECRDRNIICEVAFYHDDLKWEMIQYDHLE
jgi:hypothetical protein